MYSTFYLPLIELASVLLKIKIYNAGPTTWGRDPHPFFPKNVHFVLSFQFFAKDVLLILNVNFERDLKLQQLLQEPRHNLLQNDDVGLKKFYFFTLSFLSNTKDYNVFQLSEDL